jgi:hypothetical protein
LPKSRAGRPPRMGRPPAHVADASFNVMPDQRGEGACLSGAVGVLGLVGSGPLVSAAAGPPGLVAGTFPCVCGRSVGPVPGAVPVTELSVDPGAVDVPGLVLVWATATAALTPSSNPAIISLMFGTPLSLCKTNQRISDVFPAASKCRGSLPAEQVAVMRHTTSDTCFRMRVDRITPCTA